MLIVKKFIYDYELAINLENYVTHRSISSCLLLIFSVKPQIDIRARKMGDAPLLSLPERINYWYPGDVSA